MKWIIFLSITMFSSNVLALGPEQACFRRAVDTEDTCSVSLSTLIARGEDFDGKLVAVVGFYAYAEYPMFFTSRDAFLSSDAADGVGVKIPTNAALAEKLGALDHQYIMMVGRYHAKALDVSAFAGLRTGGHLTEIISVGATGSEPWGYSRPEPYDAKKKSR
jgi:hypothetical protein